MKNDMKKNSARYFGSNITVDIYNNFLEYGLHSATDNLVNGRIVKPARLLS